MESPQKADAPPIRTVLPASWPLMSRFLCRLFLPPYPAGTAASCLTQRHTRVSMPDSLALQMVGRNWKRLWRSSVDALLPPQCMLCTAQVDEPGRLCLDCWPGIGFIAEPCCPVCGVPYAMPVPDGLVCGACLK